MKVGMYLGKVDKFGIGWCIPTGWRLITPMGVRADPPLPECNRFKSLKAKAKNTVSI